MSFAFSPSERFRTGWKIAHDADNTGKEKRWQETGLPGDITKDAQVPGFLHLYFPECYGVAWYEKRFTTGLQSDEDHALWLRFGAADYLCEAYMNGQLAGTHRGGEDPFEFDVSGLVRTGEENLLVVRVSKPYSQDVDGYTFGEIPHRNQTPTGYIPGWCYNEVGLGGPVELVRVPRVSIGDAFLFGNVETGCVEVNYEIVSKYAEKKTVTLTTVCGVKRTGEYENSDVYTLEAEPGVTRVKREIPLKDVLLWDIADPNLYTVEMTVECGGRQHHKTGHCGFRTFEVREDGYFYLNGKRIFLRCSHTGNCMPESAHNLTRDKDLLRRDLYMAKAMGLNCVRFISGVALPEQLDYCDELGLMVYEEPEASWLLDDGDLAKELYMYDLLTMIRRDRSHPSVTIWGLLNETFDYPPHADVCRIARDCLPEVREADPTRLVLYSSGRWDGDASVGSVCNPFRDKWQCLWNEEGKNLKSTVNLGRSEEFPFTFTEYVGDVHAYPRVPISARDEHLLRTLGRKAGRPVFYSEVGVGSLFDVIWLSRKFEELGSNPESPDVKMVLGMAKIFQTDLKRYGMEEEYAFPIDLMRESQLLHNRQRMVQLNIIRSNPYSCGYSITGLLDHSLCGEGLMTYMREWKPGMADTLQAGLAKLKWCLFMDATHIYRGGEVTIEGVLANEDVLQERDYPIGIKITGKNGTVYSEEMTLTVTAEDRKYMSVPVFKKKITLDVPTGEYELRAEILEGAAAFDGRLKFHVTDAAELPECGGTAVVYGIGEKAAKLLKSRGVRTECLFKADAGKKHVVVLGDIAEEKKDEVWARVNELLAGGSRVFAASRYAFVKGEDYEHYLPMENRPLNMGHLGKISSDWLYHKEYVAKRGSRYFEGLPTGMMDWDYYMHVISGHFFECGEGQAPETAEAACFGTGIAVPDGYEGGMNIGTYPVGKGALTVCSFHLLENIGVNPAADRLLLNAVKAEQEKL